MSNTSNSTPAPHATHCNAFAGISGSVTGNMPTAEADAQLLLDPTGRWAIRLTTLDKQVALMLLQILRDLAPPATQADSTFIRQVSAFDVAARNDSSLMQEIERGLAALDVLSRKLTRRSYIEVPERTMRRALVSQISEHPLMDRLGVRTPFYSTAAM